MHQEAIGIEVVCPGLHCRSQQIEMLSQIPGLVTIDPALQAVDEQHLNGARHSLLCWCLRGRRDNTFVVCVGCFRVRAERENNDAYIISSL